MDETTVRVRHIYERDAEKFEADLNEALRRILEQGGVIDDIKYASDPPTEKNKHGGFGALVVFELPRR